MLCRTKPWLLHIKFKSWVWIVLFFFEDQLFFRGRAFVKVMAEHILDEGWWSSSSSSSTSTLRPPHSETWQNVSGRLWTPVTCKIPSNSEKDWITLDLLVVVLAEMETTRRLFIHNVNRYHLCWSFDLLAHQPQPTFRPLRISSPNSIPMEISSVDYQPSRSRHVTSYVLKPYSNQLLQSPLTAMPPNSEEDSPPSARQCSQSKCRRMIPINDTHKTCKKCREANARTKAKKRKREQEDNVSKLLVQQ